MSSVVNPKSKDSVSDGAAGGTSRVDPPQRGHLLAGYDGSLENKNPGRKYVWVSNHLRDSGIPYYRALGYDVEYQRSDGPQASGADSKGSPIQWHDNTLMSVDLERARINERKGAAGGIGLDEFGRIIRGIIKEAPVPPGVRMQNAMGDKYFGFENLSAEERS